MRLGEGAFPKEPRRTGTKCEKSSCLIGRFLSGKLFFDFITLAREIQRTLMELLNQLDGFEVLSKVKIIMATNRYKPFLRSKFLF